MSNRLPLILAVADLAYSGGEMFEALEACLNQPDFRVDLQSVSLSRVVDRASNVNHNLPYTQVA